ncbi:HVA22-like protein e [Rhodamnia argentea]|uniref:HVA22-like protein n=1 Tax=Rhodamnia argentea TaxID=178133 RepID=A0A8B8PBJ2_9MYRT|nr:HVA22-like protein e [Rhodamnia argentea]
MGRLWTVLAHAHSLAGPVLMLLYPLYASVMAIESPSKIDDEQWLAYWILYSFLTLLEMLLQPLLEWIPIWYDVKLILAAWLVLPQFKGAAFLYERFVRERILKRHLKSCPTSSSPIGNGKPKSKNKFVDFITPKKGEHEAY